MTNTNKRIAKILVVLLLIVSVFACSSVPAEATSYSKYERGLASYIRYSNSGIGTSSSLVLARYYNIYGKRYKISPRMIMAIAKNESNFYWKAYNPAGYRGSMQCSAALARYYGYKPSSLFRKSVGIYVGTRYLRRMRNMFPKSWTKTISAYAYGEGSVLRGHYSTAHAKKIFSYYNKIGRYLRTRGYYN